MNRDETRSTRSTNLRAGLAPTLGLRSGSEAIRQGPDRSPAFRSLLVDLPDEAMVIDERSVLTPAQMVESKLMTRLRESSLPASHLQMRGLLRYRGKA